MPGEYEAALRKRLISERPLDEADRAAVYMAATQALPSMLEKAGITDVEAERVALAQAIRSIEADLQKGKPARRRRRVFEELIAVMIFGVLLYPLYVPPDYMPQWILNHPWITIVWGTLWATSIMLILLLYYSLAARAATSKGQRHVDAMRSMAPEYLYEIPFGIALLLVIFSGLLYNLGNIAKYYNPFGRSFDFLDALLFMLDAGVKGLFSELIDLTGFSLQNKLRYVKTDHLIFWAVMLVYKSFMTLVTIGIVVLFVRWFVGRLLRFIWLRVGRPILAFLRDSRRRQMAFIYRWTPGPLKPFMAWNIQLDERSAFYSNRTIFSWSQMVSQIADDPLIRPTGKKTAK